MKKLICACVLCLLPFLAHSADKALMSNRLQSYLTILNNISQGQSYSQIEAGKILSPGFYKALNGVTQATNRTEYLNHLVAVNKKQGNWKIQMIDTFVCPESNMAVTHMTMDMLQGKFISIAIYKFGNDNRISEMDEVVSKVED